MWVYVCLGILVVFFIVPWRIGAEVRTTSPEAPLRAWLYLGFGLVGISILRAEGRNLLVPELCSIRTFRFRVGGKKQKAVDDTEAPDEEREAKGDEEPKPAKSVLDRVREAKSYYDRFKRPAIGLLGRLGKTIRFRHLIVQGQLGAGQPEATGKLYGYIQAANGMTGDRVRIDLRPDFVEGGFKGRARFEIWFSIVRLLVAVLIAAPSVGVRMLVWFVASRWRRWRQPQPEPA